MESLFDAAKNCLMACAVEEKLQLTAQTAQAWRDGLLALASHHEPEPIREPGRPDKPVLIAPDDVPKRRLNTPEGLAVLIHAVTHIEFNAINLAWDAVYRFRDLPRQFYADWIKVAAEEAHHFQLLRQRLNALGSDYGDFPAHNGLWDMAVRTAFDPLVRMALVPRVLEARGLDVTPGMIARLRQAGDEETVAVLEIILRDEIGHVAIGSHWFQYLCRQRGLDAGQTFQALIGQYLPAQICGPFHYAARQQAGFSAAELKMLEQMGTGKAQSENTTP
ncbi:MAG: ferritin-like domain-containing protein [Betaproteobacteria bacterium]|nr:ferritin-like domain-containing protein [Betaproteobacteria bacterium]